MVDNIDKEKIIGWATDTHLDHVRHDKAMFQVFANQLIHAGCEALVISGDVSVAGLLCSQLRQLSDLLGPNFPIYFVCGNHDFYGGSFASVRAELTEFCEANSQICYLHEASFVPIGSETALIGADGWYDGLYSSVEESRLLMNDFFHIRDLVSLHKYQKAGPVFHETNGPLHRKMQELSEADAAAMYRKAKAAIDSGFRKLVLVTHIPPFPDNSIYNGRRSDKDWMPFFSSKNMGDKLLDLADEHPEVNFTVLCGHAHGEANFSAGRENFICRTGKADYGYPRLADILSVK